jgi:hypothetical protein
MECFYQHYSKKLDLLRKTNDFKVSTEEIVMKD